MRFATFMIHSAFVYQIPAF